MEKKGEQIPVVQVSTPATAEAKVSLKTYTPPVDIYETKENFVIIADVPGVDDKSLEITVEKNVLTINGRVEPMECKGHDLTYREYELGNYRRSFVLSGEIDRDKIEGTVKDGVLRLTLPKAEQVKVRKITVH